MSCKCGESEEWHEMLTNCTCPYCTGKNAAAHWVSVPFNDSATYLEPPLNDTATTVDAIFSLVAQLTKEQQKELYTKIYHAFDHCRIYAR